MMVMRMSPNFQLDQNDAIAFHSIHVLWEGTEPIDMITVRQVYEDRSTLLIDGNWSTVGW